MANVTRKLIQLEDRFPPGTSVQLFKASGRKEDDKPVGTAVATATVAADGSVSFTGVPDDGAGYVAYALLGGRHVYVRTGSGAVSWAARH